MTYDELAELQGASGRSLLDPTRPRLFESDDEHDAFLDWLYTSRRRGRA